MKKSFTFLVFAIVLLSSNQANAKIRRVGFFGAPVAGTDYTNLQAAHDSANTKDTIMLFPGNWHANISKKIVMLGYGYFVTGAGANANLQTIKGALNVQLYLNAGADSSVYEGIDGLNMNISYGQKTDKVIVRRCNGSISFNDQALDSWQITQCYLNSLSNYGGGGSVTNLKVSNSYINNTAFSNNEGANQSTGQFINDVIYNSNFNQGSFIIKNSIFIDYHDAGNCVFQNSIGTDYYPIPEGNGNKNITYSSMQNDIFVGYYNQGSYSNDERWALKAGSPAKGAGTGGIDVGIFGGLNPYKLSGIPRTPSFFKLSAAGTTTGSNPYTITFSVRSNN